MPYTMRLPDGRTLYVEVPGRWVTRDRGGQAAFLPEGVRFLDRVRGLALSLNGPPSPGHITALREALASTRIRGQWGERMAEDVLRLVGFVQGVNYLKQSTINAGGEDGGSRPDYTFLLPQDLTLNMDVKFPLDNYLKCIEAKDAEEEARYRQQFVRDVRARLKEVVTRDYIDPGRKTLDYVLVFIPNEQIYQYVHEHDSALIDDALASKVVLCSPVSLCAILVVIRQAINNFNVEQSANEIISYLGAFDKQWGEFVGQMDRVERNLSTVHRQFEQLAGRRRRALERPLDRINAIREQRGLALPEDTGQEDLPELNETLIEATEPIGDDQED